MKSISKNYYYLGLFLFPFFSTQEHNKYLMIKTDMSVS